MSVIFIHVVEETDLFIFIEGDDFVDIFKPCLLGDEAAVDLIYLAEQVVKTNLLLYRLLSQTDQQFLYLKSRELLECFVFHQLSVSSDVLLSH